MPAVSPPPDYGSALEQAVLHRLPSQSQPKGKAKIIAPLFISLTWLSAAAACLFLTIKFSAEPVPAANFPLEYTLIEEELSQVSETEIQEWIAESNSEIPEEVLINELLDNELYAE